MSRETSGINVFEGRLSAGRANFVAENPNRTSDGVEMVFQKIYERPV